LGRLRGLTLSCLTCLRALQRRTCLLTLSQRSRKFSPAAPAALVQRTCTTQAAPATLCWLGEAGRAVPTVIPRWPGRAGQAVRMSHSPLAGTCWPSCAYESFPAGRHVLAELFPRVPRCWPGRASGAVLYQARPQLAKVCQVHRAPVNGTWRRGPITGIWRRGPINGTFRESLVLMVPHPVVATAAMAGGRAACWRAGDGASSTRLLTQLIATALMLRQRYAFVGTAGWYRPGVACASVDCWSKVVAG